MIWPHMGPWPVFVGFTTSEKRFRKEMKKLGHPDEPFILNAHSHATLHTLENKEGKLTFVITMRPKNKGIKQPQLAAMLAHEATHVIQHMRDRLGSLGSEAEAYIVQYIVQCCLFSLRDKTC